MANEQDNRLETCAMKMFLCTPDVPHPRVSTGQMTLGWSHLNTMDN